MIPLYTRLRGIGPYSDTRVNWSNLPSPIAICAPYGTGKTWMLEGFFGSLYGRFAWYSGSIYDALTQGGTGKGSLESGFEQNGKKYRVERILSVSGKTKSQKAHLWEYGKNEPIAGPKVGDVDRAVKALVGDPDIALATWFLDQDKTGDLCGVRGKKNITAHRRSIFSELIGANALDAQEKKLGESVRETHSIACDLEAQLAGEDGYDNLIECENNRIKEYQIGIERNNQSNEADSEKLEILKTQLRDTQLGDDALRGQINRYETARLALDSANTHFETIIAEIETLERRVAMCTVARADLEEHSSLIGKRAILWGQKTKFDDWSVWSKGHTVLTHIANNAQMAVTTLKSLVDIPEGTRVLALRLEALREEYKASKATNEERSESNRKLEQSAQELRRKITDLRTRIEIASKRLGAKPDAFLGDLCEKCPERAEYLSLPIEIEKWQNQLEVFEKKQRELSASAEFIDLVEIKGEGERSRAAADIVAKAKEAQGKLDEAQSNLDVANKKLFEHNEGAPPESPDPSKEISETQKSIDELAGAAERVAACAQASTDILGKQGALESAGTAFESAKKEHDESSEPAASAALSLKNTESQQSRIKYQIDKQERVVDETNKRTQEIVAQKTRAETLIEGYEKAIEKQAKKRIRIQALRNKHERLKTLRECFGPRGVRQILIDDAAPALEDIAADLFQRATGGRMQLRIATQKTLEDGSLAETFDILVQDKRGERDVLRYSGGELKLILILFRIAVAIWSGEVHNSTFYMLAMDETFDSLGAEGSEDLLRVLDYLSDRISFLIVVTHDPALADLFRSQIRMKETAGGIQIKLIGAHADVA